MIRRALGLILVVTVCHCAPRELEDIAGVRVVPAGYKYYKDLSYYKFYTTHATFLEALATCAKDGGHLLILNSEQEHDVIQKIFAEYPNDYDYAFVGIHDMFTEGHFETIFGDPLESTGFHRWHAGEPTNGSGNDGNEDCGSVQRTGGLNDIRCYKMFPFFCELEV